MGKAQFVRVILPDHTPARPTTAAEDAALVQRMSDGDPAALSSLYERHSPAIYSHAMHLFGEVAESEDAVEETFWRAWRKAEDYDPSGPDVATWLLMICRQRATERLQVKRRVNDRLVDDTTGLGPGDGTFASGESEPARDRIAASLNGIPADQRTVLELAFFRGMTPADVAMVTKQSPETARTRLRVAMRKLREALSEAPPGVAPGHMEGAT